MRNNLYSRFEVYRSLRSTYSRFLDIYVVLCVLPWEIKFQTKLRKSLWFLQTEVSLLRLTISSGKSHTLEDIETRRPSVCAPPALVASRDARAPIVGSSASGENRRNAPRDHSAARFRAQIQRTARPSHRLGSAMPPQGCEAARTCVL